MTCTWCKITLSIAKKGFYKPKKIFGKKPLKPFFRGPFPPHLHKKSGKSNEAILYKVQKTLFLGGFWPKFGQKFFPENQAPSHFGHCYFASCAKNQQKIMSQSREGRSKN